MKEFKFIGASDLHIRNRSPEKRVDDFVAAQKRKMAWLFKTAKEQQAAILCGGDVFDSSTVPYRVVREYITLAKKHGVKFITVYGQHDLRYHAYASNENTPLSVLVAAIDGCHVDEECYENELVCIQGASWEREYPVPKPGKINILLTHRLVTEGEGLWPGHVGYYKAENIVQYTGFDIVISGDNHQSFMMEKDGKYLFNPGSIMRLTIAQYDYKPRVPLITVTKDAISYEWLDVPIKSPDIVFSKSNDVEKSEDDVMLSRIQTFVDNLYGKKLDSPNFISNLQAAAKEASPTVHAAITKIIKRTSDAGIK